MLIEPSRSYAKEGVNMGDESADIFDQSPFDSIDQIREEEQIAKRRPIQVVDEAVAEDLKDLAAKKGKQDG